MNLTDLGWNEFFSREFEKYKSEGFAAARVAREHKERYQLNTESGELTAEITGRLRHLAVSRADFPAVGDWVAITPFDDNKSAVIHAVLPRKSKFLRKAAGIKTDEQIVAANIDTVFLVMGLDGDFNPSRLERYMTSAWDSGATPIVVLNKTDLCNNLEERIEEVRASAFEIPTVAISASHGEGLDRIRELIKPGQTAAFLGSSGVGKSTIINGILGEDRLLTREVREDDSRGRHTTTWRELVLIPGGGIVIDTPGMREFQLWTDDNSLKGLFEDIERLAESCKFNDCSHAEEPGCAIQAAIENGDLSRTRYNNYVKMQKEIRYLEQRQSGKTDMIAKNKWKEIHKRMRKFNQYRKKKGIKT